MFKVIVVIIGQIEKKEKKNSSKIRCKMFNLLCN